jgi:NTP pyrophosphatase (non-canonical NTP hydrolase)
MLDENIQKRWDSAVAERKEALASAAVWFARLYAQMADLRGPGGCPWDREQSLASLRQYVREEADEVCSAIDAILALEAELRSAAGLPAANPEPAEGEDMARTEKKGHTIEHHPQRADFNAQASASGAPLPAQLETADALRREQLYTKLTEELGDLLLQPLFMGDILSGMGRPGVERSLESIVTKLIRRHPHVYGEASASSSAEVLANWEAIKREEARDAGELPPSGPER